MKTPLITLIIVGASTVAGASPNVTASGKRAPGPVTVVDPYRRPPPIRDGFVEPRNTTVGPNSSGYEGPIFRNPRDGRFGRGGWLALTEPTRIDGGREFFPIEGRGGDFRRLQLRGIAGRTTITKVAIEYGKEPYERVQVADVRATLDRRNQILTIRLDGDSRDINRIIVYGASGRRSAYQLFTR
jgi:hypothetical protein